MVSFLVRMDFMHWKRAIIHFCFDGYPLKINDIAIAQYLFAESYKLVTHFLQTVHSNAISTNLPLQVCPGFAYSKAQMITVTHYSQYCTQ